MKHFSICKKLGLTLSVILLVGAAFWQLLPDTEAKKSDAESAETNQHTAHSENIGIHDHQDHHENTGSVERHNHQVSAVTEDAAISEENHQQVFTSSPSKATYKNDVHGNVHGLPKSLRSFASEMTELMTHAKQNEENGIEAFDKLQECATADAAKSILVVRTVCAKNAGTLATLYPAALESDFLQMKGQLSHKMAVLMK